MVALSRVPAREVHKTSYKHMLTQLGWLGAALLFVAMLYLSYGVDLSPGFFQLRRKMRNGEWTSHSPLLAVTLRPPPAPAGGPSNTSSAPARRLRTGS
jgi:hypothetical protein